ncbi:MAG: hypothetical protein FD167_2555 [bacterium]|nr:MAG: hypothetical protein FD167_2555 [bacterium]
MSEERVILCDVNVAEHQNNEVEIKVVVGYKKSTYSSRVISPSEQHHRLRSVAHATVQALNELLRKSAENQDVLIKLIDFRTLVLASINQVVFLVVIEIVEAEGETFVSGSSMAQIEALHIEEEAKFSVARATLNATNRKVSRYI